MKNFILFLMIFAIAKAEIGDDDAYAHGCDICATTDYFATVYIGKMGDAECNANSLPDEWISMGMTGLAYLKTDESAYLTDSSKVFIIPKGDHGHIYAEKDVEATDSFGNDATYAFVTAGTWMGEKDVGYLGTQAWGYVGTASYLLQSGNVKFR